MNEKAIRVVFMEGFYFIMRPGAQWRELPGCLAQWCPITPPNKIRGHFLDVVLRVRTE